MRCAHTVSASVSAMSAAPTPCRRPTATVSCARRWKPASTAPGSKACSRCPRCSRTDPRSGHIRDDAVPADLAGPGTDPPPGVSGPARHGHPDPADRDARRPRHLVHQQQPAAAGPADLPAVRGVHRGGDADHGRERLGGRRGDAPARAAAIAAGPDPDRPGQPFAEEHAPADVGDLDLRGSADDPRHRAGQARPGLDRHADRAGRPHPVRGHLQRSQRPRDAVHHRDPDDPADGRPRRHAGPAPAVLDGGGGHPALWRLPDRLARIVPGGHGDGRHLAVAAPGPARGRHRGRGRHGGADGPAHAHAGTRRRRVVGLRAHRDLVRRHPDVPGQPGVRRGRGQLHRAHLPDRAQLVRAGARRNRDRRLHGVAGDGGLLRADAGDGAAAAREDGGSAAPGAVDRGTADGDDPADRDGRLLRLRLLPEPQLRDPALHPARPGHRLVRRRAGALGGPARLQRAARLVQVVRARGRQRDRAVDRGQGPVRDGGRMSTRGQVIRNTLFSSVGIYTEYFLGMLTSIVIARHLGPADFGAYSLVIWLVATGVVITNSGVASAVIKFVAELRGAGRESQIRSLLAWAWRVQGGFLAVVLLGGTALFLLQGQRLMPGFDHGLLLLILLDTTALRASYMLNVGIAKGYENFRATAAIAVIVAPLNLLLILLV